MSEPEDMRKATQGDDVAFLRCVERVEKRLFQTAVGILGNRHDAEDAWQNALLNAWRSRRRLRKPEAFNTWLTTILLNEARLIFRKRAREPVPQPAVVSVSDCESNCAERLDVCGGLQRLI